MAIAPVNVFLLCDVRVSVIIIPNGFRLKCDGLKLSMAATQHLNILVIIIVAGHKLLASLCLDRFPSLGCAAGK